MGVGYAYPETRPIFWKVKLYVDNNENKNCHFFDSEFLKMEDYICLSLCNKMPCKYDITQGVFLGFP